MKKALLFVLFIGFFAFVASAQYDGDCGDCVTEKYESGKNKKPEQIKPSKAKKTKVSVYPNPAVNYIGLSDSKDVKKIVIFNVMGREAKSFTEIEAGLKYDVGDLKRGMYLVQIVDYKNKVITTQRLNKG